MKYISNKIIIFAGLISVSLMDLSCQKDAFTKANENPNSPSSESIVPANILPAVENGIAYTQGGDMTRFATLFVQQSTGFSRQASAYYNYVLTSTDFDSPWGNMYTSGLGNNKDLMQRSDAREDNAYGGISRILMAYSLQLLVDQFGDVPYSQALMGDANTHPTYDGAAGLYDTIQSLTTVAIAKLNDVAGDPQSPESDDIIYGGNTDKWIKFAHAIKARLYIHQSKGNAAMAQKALDEANLAFTSNDDNAQYLYGDAETNANPIYQFNSQRGDIDYASGVLPDLLISKSDPRKNMIINTDYSDENAAGIGDYYGSINAPVEFITYEEILFIKAEATLRTSGNIATAQGYFQDAIKASMDKLGVSGGAAATYIAANGTLPLTVADAIKAVAVQEYISLANNPEAWALWRRTDSPTLVPTAGTNGVPRRFLYPQNAYSLNKANVPAGATLFAPKLFWDN